jgi:hypothetical protein
MGLAGYGYRRICSDEVGMEKHPGNKSLYEVHCLPGLTHWSAEN